MDIAAVRAKVIALKSKEQEIKRQEALSKLEDLRAELSLDRRRQTALSIEIKKAKDEAESLRADRADVESFKDKLGEEYEASIKAVDEALEAATKRRMGLESEYTSIESSIASSEGIIESISNNFLAAVQRPTTSGASSFGLPAVQGASSNAVPFMDNETEKMLQYCSPDVVGLAKDVKALPSRLSGFQDDERAMYFMLKVEAAKYRVLTEQEGRSETEMTVLRRTRGILGRMVFTFGIKSYYIEALNERHTQDWGKYLDYSKKQSREYFMMTPAEKAASGPALAKEVPGVGAKVVAHISLPAAPKPKRASARMKPVPKEEPKESDPPLDPALARSCAAMRVLVLGGERQRNEPLRAWIEERFGFKSVRWYDSNTDDMLRSVRARGADLLLVFHKFHVGYKQFSTVAEAYGVKVVVVSGTNKEILEESLKGVITRGACMKAGSAT